MRRTLILFGVALLLVIVAAFFAFFFGQKGSGDNTGSTSGSGFFASLFPFGNNSNSGTPTSVDNAPTGTGSDTRSVPALRQVSKDPVSGAFVYTKEDGTPTIRYIERSTGHLYEVPAEKTEALRISNTTIPGIYETLFVDENHFVIRYPNEKEITENFYASVIGSAEDQSLGGSFLKSWARAALDPAKKNLLAVYSSQSGSSVELSKPDGSGARVVLTSPIRSWIPLQSNTSAFVYTAPTANADGFLYRVAGGALIKVFGDLPGLIANVDASGRYALVSGNDGGGVALYLVDTQTGERYESPVSTFANKCAFVSEKPVKAVCGVPEDFPNGMYPDDWLAGVTSFTDDLWLIEPVAGVATLLSLPSKDANADVDVWQPIVDDTGSYFDFINKKDLSLWSLRLVEEPVATTTPN